MKILSLFDGIGTGYAALKQAGITVTRYYASEVDNYCKKVSMGHHPTIIQLGDVRNVSGAELPKIDLLIGGSPCSGFSSAGKRKGFDDPRSALFWEYARILDETKPRFFLLENVPMRPDDQNIISSVLGCNPVTINSSHFVPQNRERLYWTNIPILPFSSVSQTWNEVREYGVKEPRWYYGEGAMRWIIQSSRRRGVSLKILDETVTRIGTVDTGYAKKYGNQRFWGIPDDGCWLPMGNGIIYADGGLYCDDGTLLTKGRIPSANHGIRYITPLECERLQGLPDNYTAAVSATQRYKMIGNGWTLPVIAHILRGIGV